MSQGWKFARNRARLLGAALIGKLIEDFVLIRTGRRLDRVTSFDRTCLNGVHRRELALIGRIAGEGGGGPRAGSGGLGLHKTKVRVEPYDPAWAVRFEEEKAVIRGALGGLPNEVHHIGSTSVPGLSAKPIIDIGVALDAENFERSFKACSEALAKVGYEYMGDRGRMGGRYFEKGPRQVRTSAIQVHSKASPDFGRLLRFREMLLGSPALCAEYDRVKNALAEYLGNWRLTYVWTKAHWVNGHLLESHGEGAWTEWVISSNPRTLPQVVKRQVLLRLGLAKPRSSGPAPGR